MQRDLGEDAVAHVNAMRVILRGCEHQLRERDIARVQVDHPALAPLLFRHPLLKLVGEQLGRDQVFRIYQPVKRHKLPEQMRPHLFLVVVRLVKCHDLAHRVNVPEPGRYLAFGRVKQIGPASQHPHKQLYRARRLNVSHVQASPPPRLPRQALTHKPQMK